MLHVIGARTAQPAVLSASRDRASRERDPAMSKGDLVEQNRSQGGSSIPEQDAPLGPAASVEHQACKTPLVTEACPRGRSWRDEGVSWEER